MALWGAEFRVLVETLLSVWREFPVGVVEKRVNRTAVEIFDALVATKSKRFSASFLHLGTGVHDCAQYVRARAPGAQIGSVSMANLKETRESVRQPTPHGVVADIGTQRSVTCFLSDGGGPRPITAQIQLARPFYASAPEESFQPFRRLRGQTETVTCAEPTQTTSMLSCSQIQTSHAKQRVESGMEDQD